MALHVNEPVETFVLEAVPGSAFNHELHDHFSADICHPDLTPEQTKPVFAAPKALAGVREAVAVAFRDTKDVPVHGGLYSVVEGRVVRLILSDVCHGINTGEDPAWTAFGLNMSIGKFLLKAQGEAAVEIQWHPIDFGASEIIDGRVHRPMLGIMRQAVCDWYVENVAPLVLDVTNGVREEAIACEAA